MKKITLMAAAAIVLLATSGCMGIPGAGQTTTTNTQPTGANVLGGLLGAVGNGEALGNIFTSVIGLDKLTAEQLIGTWRYDGAGCAFTSQDALAQAGGEVAAAQVEEKLNEQYRKLGFSAANTAITFNADGTFQATLNGKNMQGQYTYSEKDGAVNLQTLLLNLNGYVKRNGAGISILFESKKAITLIQTLSALSNSQYATTINSISKNYDGVRIGFDLKK